MKQRKKRLALTLCAALLVSSCGTGSPAATAADTSAADVTEEVSAATTETDAPPETTKTEVAAIDGEEDTRPGKNDNVKYTNTDIWSMPYYYLFNKPIVCDNIDTLHLTNSLDDGLYEGEAPISYNGGDHLNYVLTFNSDGYRFRPMAKISGGAISAECDDGFKASVDSYNSGWWGEQYITSWTPENTKIYLNSVDNNAVYADKIEYGYNNYGKVLAVNGFIRKSDETDRSSYDIIIDPACMRDLKIPMLEYNPEKMKFEVNGTEFYAETVKGRCSRSWISNISDDIGDEYVYARIGLIYTSMMYNNTDGAYMESDILTAEVLSDDTDGIINGDVVYTPETYSALVPALENAKDILFTEKTINFELIDLDSDGVPEVMVQELCGYTDTSTGETVYSYPDGPYATAPTKFYRITADGVELLGESDVSVGQNMEKAIFTDTNEEGWHFENGKGHSFMTMKNGKLSINDLLGIKYDEDGNWDYYYLGEKIVPEPVTLYSPLRGTDVTFYRMKGNDELGLFEFESSYEMYDRLYRSLNNKFVTLSKHFIGIPLKGGYGTDEINIMKPSANFPNDVLASFEASQKSAEYSEILLGSYTPEKEKPVIYLYPEEQTDVSVKVNFPLGGELTCTYPEYNDGWNVTAMPDGTLYDENGDEYYCLYWEGVSRDVMDSSTGFCVKGSDTAQFLREKLMYIGLTAREANEFIIYWLPRMEDNPYNIITFHTADYAASVPLAVSPAPDSQIRVFMTFSPSTKPADIPEQQLPHYERNGFTLVEWGGAETSADA